MAAKSFNQLKKLAFLSCLSVLLASCGGGGTPPPAGNSVSGTITAAENSAVDSDVNDPYAPYQSNDSFATAQSISNPVNLAGYLNVALSGKTGRSYSSGDIKDYYSATLSAGQTITLSEGDSASSDIDIYLYDSNQALKDSDVGGGASKQLTVPSDGNYYIKVEIASGASTYVLSTALSSAAELGGLKLSSDFIDGEVIVKFKDKVTLSSSKTSLLTSLGLDVNAGKGGQVQLLSLPDESDSRKSALSNMLSKSMISEMSGVDDETRRKMETLYMVGYLQQLPDVEYAEPNYIYRLPEVERQVLSDEVSTMATANDSHYSKQWHYPLIEVDTAWDLTAGTTNTVVAVIDTGILPLHPDLDGSQTTTGYDFISSSTYSGDGGGLDSDPTDVHDGSSLYVFHGTHVAGTIAAETNNSLGVAGVSGNWPVKIMPLRVLGSDGSGSTYDIAQAIRYAAGLTNDSGIQLTGSDVASIINMSLGGPSVSTTMDLAVAEARNAGVIVIAAAGNSASSLPSYPAASAGVVSVSSVGADKLLAPYSNYGSTIDVAAPGGNSGADYNGDGYPDGVLSTDGEVRISGSTATVDYVYSFLQGTSMATPHVTGIAAMMKTLYPTMTPSEFDSWLASGSLTQDIGPLGRDDNYGYGLINAYEAAVTATNAGTSNPSPLLYFSPSSLDFGLSTTLLNIDVSNLGGGTPSVQTPVSGASWLTVAASASVGTDGLGRYVATVDRTQLPGDGSYSTIITFLTSTAPGTREIPVTVRKLTASASNDAGLIHVLAISPVTGGMLGQDAVEAVNGEYAYSISDLSEGSYLIIAGSDLDNDLYICDSGESCGAYPTYGQMSQVSVTGNVTGIDFSVSFGVAFSGAKEGDDKSVASSETVPLAEGYRRKP